jgi:hypothetical protein
MAETGTNGTLNQQAAADAINVVADNETSLMQNNVPSLEDTLLSSSKGQSDFLLQYTKGPENGNELLVRCHPQDDKERKLIARLLVEARISVNGYVDESEIIGDYCKLSMTYYQDKVIQAHAGVLDSSGFRPLRRGMRGGVARARSLENREIES